MPRAAGFEQKPIWLAVANELAEDRIKSERDGTAQATAAKFLQVDLRTLRVDQQLAHGHHAVFVHENRPSFAFRSVLKQAIDRGRLP